MRAANILFLTLVAIQTVPHCCIPKFAPLNIVYHSYTQCPGWEERPMKLFLKSRRIDGKQYLYGNFTSDIIVGDNMAVKVRMDYKIKEEKPWKTLATLTSSDTCKFLDKTTGVLFVDVLKHIGVPPRCPIPKGTFEVKNFLPDLSSLSKFKIPVAKLFLTGETFDKSGKILFCFNATLSNDAKT